VLYAQLESLEEIQNRRKQIWNFYYNSLKYLEEAGLVKFPQLPAYATNNGHIFYMIFDSLEKRTAYIDHMKANGVQTVFHYIALHSSPHYKDKHDDRELPMVEVYQDCLVRLPLFYDLEDQDVEKVIALTRQFFA